jgi:hypothetical protein
MRAHAPGGRFDADFETNKVLEGVDSDLKRPVGTSCKWFVWDPENTDIDPIYDVGQDLTSSTGGRSWRGPFDLPVVRAVIKQGGIKNSQRGYYGADSLHLTLNAEDVEKVVPGVIGNPDLQARGRILWKNQVYRPYYIQQAGIIAERYTLLIVECMQVMADEMVNDPQFLALAGYIK